MAGGLLPAVWERIGGVADGQDEILSGRGGRVSAGAAPNSRRQRSGLGHHRAHPMDQDDKLHDHVRALHRIVNSTAGGGLAGSGQPRVASEIGAEGAKRGAPAGRYPVRPADRASGRVALLDGEPPARRW